MSFQKDFSLAEEMSEAEAGGETLAWRLLATLEGGSLLLATSALLAYTVRKKIVRQNRTRRNIRNVLVTNITNLLGRELKSRLEAHGYVVETVDQSYDVTDTRTWNSTSSDKVDAIVVVGAEPKADGLDGLSSLVTDDIYQNLRLLESVSSRVRPGGYIAWACARDSSSALDAFSDAGAAFDTVLRASLHQTAELYNCEALWVCRPTGVAEETVAALIACSQGPSISGFSIRNAAHRVGECLGRWLKILT